MPAETALGVREAARKARRAASVLGRLPDADRAEAVRQLARALAAAGAVIAKANARDLEAARPLVAAGRMSDAMLKRLVLDAPKLKELVAAVEAVASLPDPLGRVTLATELDEDLVLRRVTCPIGVIGVIFESRPDVLAQIAALCVRSGNAALLKGGSEAGHTNRALFDVVREAAREAGLPEDSFALLEGREEIAELLEADGDVDLIIPRGSSDLVRHVQSSTRIPVLGHADGRCHVYVDEAADLEKALAIALDSKVQYPAACNSAETLLVHFAVAHPFVPRVVKALRAKSVEVRGDARTVELARGEGVVPAGEGDWDTEYGDLTVNVRVVDSLEEAVAHVNEHGSHHTDAIVTEDLGAAERFLSDVDSAGVFHNASTRFADGFRYGFGAEVGISTGKLHPRGPVGLEGLVTYKYRLRGDGHVVSRYSGPGARAFTHRRVDIRR